MQYLEKIEEPAPEGSWMNSGYSAELPDGDYMIVSAANPNLFLDIGGSNYPALGGDNVSIYQIYDNLPAYEVWNLQYSDGFYTIRQKGTDMCLDIAYGSTECGANVQVAGSNGGGAQQWAISRFGDYRGYRLQSRCSGFSMDINGGTIASGTNVQQWTGNDSDAQRWLFIPYEPPKTIENGRYILVSALNPRLVLDISGDTGNVPNETNVQVWNDSAPSRYNSIDVEYLGHGYYRLKHAASGKSIDVYNSSVELGANIQLFTSSDQNNQKWAIMKHNDGYILVSRHSGYVMDVTDGGTADGTNVVQCTYNGSNAQTWKFVRAEYTVKYDANGGSGAPAAQTKYYANTLTLSNTKPTLSGKVFKGWATSKGATSANYQPGGSYTGNNDLTLYAVWGNIGVSGVSLNASSAALKVGETKQLAATVSPSDATNKAVTWTSSNTSVATVSASGLVTGTGEGTADITAATKDGNKKAVCKITVSRTDISGFTASLATTSYIYDGKAKQPAVTVKNGSVTLTSGNDYSVSYGNNTNVGTATAAITGKGRYKGTKTLTFKINAASLAGAGVTGISNKTYNGAAQTQSPVVKVGDRTLTNGTDYTLSYTNNINAGTATVTITGKGNYSGTVSKNFTISAASLSGAEVSGIAGRTYNGTAQTQNPTVKVGGRTLTNGTDYTLSYANNTNAGTATVTITGKGNYTGTISKAFTISAASLSGAEVSGIAGRTYNGAAQTQSPTV